MFRSRGRDSAWLWPNKQSLSLYTIICQIDSTNILSDKKPSVLFSKLQSPAEHRGID